MKKEDKNQMTIDSSNIKPFKTVVEGFIKKTKARYPIVSKPNKHSEPELYKAWYRYHAN